MKAPFNVLVSASGRRVALVKAFRESLKSLGLPGSVFAADISPLSSAFHVADRSFIVPRCADPDFIPRLLEICAQNQVALVVPTIDTELPALSNAKSEFRSIGCTVGISSPDVIAIANDKVRTHQWLVEAGLPTVEQAYPVTEGALSRIGTPAIVKPRFGSASIGVRKVDSWSDACMAEGKDLVLQAIAPGIEHTVDVYVSGEGRCLVSVPRRRLEVRAGEVSKGMTVRDAGLMAVAEQAAERLPGAWGVLNIQIFWDARAGKASIIEINPRFGGGYPLSHHAGAQLTTWLIQEVLQGECPASNRSWESGVVMLRWDDAVFVRAEDVGIEA